MKRNGLVPWTRGTWRLLVVAFASGFGLAAGTAGEIHVAQVEGTPVQAQFSPACAGGTCAIEKVDCGLGEAPAMSEECEPGQRCKKVANSCWGVKPFQLPIYGSVECVDCKTQVQAEPLVIP